MKIQRIIFIVFMTWTLVIGQAIAGQDSIRQDTSGFYQKGRSASFG